MNEDDPIEVVDDFLERHVDVIATHLLYLRVQRALASAKRRKHHNIDDVVAILNSLPD